MHRKISECFICSNQIRGIILYERCLSIAPFTLDTNKHDPYNVSVYLVQILISLTAIMILQLVDEREKKARYKKKRHAQ